MLFHGTNKQGATGVLNGGFKNSESGWFGSGVYMTDCSYIALTYAAKYNEGFCYCHNFIFVNEVLESEKLQTFEFEIIDMKDVSTPLKNPFNKHTRKKSPQKKQSAVKKTTRKMLKGDYTETLVMIK